MQKAYQGAGQGGCGQEYANQYQNQSHAGPSADEVDWDFLWMYFFLSIFLKIYNINKDVYQIFLSYNSV